MRDLFQFTLVALLLVGPCVEAYAAESQIEFVLYESTGVEEEAFQLTPADASILTTFASEPFLTFAVPPSPKRKALFLELWAQALYKWTNLETRRVQCVVSFRIVSDLIPSNVEIVTNGATVIDERESNTGGNFDLGFRRSRRTEKYPVRRDRLDYWMVRDTVTGEPLSPQDAIALLNGILDAGFTVEVFTFGQLRGVEDFILIPVSAEVTRLGK